MRDIVINSLDIHTDRQVQVEVYTRVGSFSNSITSVNGWELIANTSVVGAGRGIPTPIPKESFDKWVDVRKGKTQGFFVSLTTGDIRYSIRDEPTGAIYRQNNDLKLTIGIANSKYSFGEYHESRLWNGVVHYTVKANPGDALPTTFQGTEKSYGNVFDIMAFTDITINSIDLNIDSEEKTRVEIWTTNSTTNENQHWTKICQAEIQAQGKKHPSSVPPHAFTPVSVSRGKRQTFMITLTVPKLIYSNAPPEYENGDEMAQNDDLAILVGVVLLEYPYKNLLQNKKYFNGIIRYGTNTEERECQTIGSLTNENSELSSWYGVMFNVQALRSLTIQTMEIDFVGVVQEDKISSGSRDINYTIWTQPGRYQDQTTNWIKVYDSAQSNDVVTSSIIDPSLFTPIIMPPDSTQAIFVFFEKSAVLRLSRPTNRDKIISSNNDLQITRGQPVDNKYDVGREYLFFQGSIHYYFSEDWSCNRPTAFPSITPSISPSDIPSYAPSFTTNDPTAVASDTPTLMPTSHEPTFIASRLPSAAPSTSPSSIPTATPSEYELGLVSIINNEIDLIFSSFKPSQSIILHDFFSDPMLSRINDAPAPFGISQSPSTSVLSYNFPTYKPTTEQPTSTPTTKLADDQLITFAIYSHSVEHEVETNSSQIQSLLESTLSLYLRAFFDDTSSELYELSEQSNLDLASVKSSIEEGTFSNTKCTPTTKNNVCTTLNTNVTTIHDDSVSTEVIRYFLYKYGPILGKSLPFPSANYTGLQPLLTYQLVKLNGEDLSPLQEEENAFYESTVKSFLDSLVDNSIAITGVTTDTSRLGILNSEKRRLQQRSTSSSDNLDIDTGILGEYKPPPEINFDALIQESFDNHGDLLLNKLSEKQYFQKVKDIKSYTSFSNDKKPPQVKIKSTEKEPPKENNSSAATSTTAIIVYAICGPLLIVSIVVICCVLNKYGKDDVIVFDEDPNFLSKLSYAQQQEGSGGTIATSRSNSMYASRRSFGMDDCSYGVRSNRSRPYY